MRWTTACPDWERRLVQRLPIIPDPLFPEQADAAFRIWDSLRIVDAPGSPTMAEAALPWSRRFVGAIFGAYDHEGAAGEPGARLISEFFLLISKKNGKSSNAAAIMLTALLVNWRTSAEYGILAPTIEVAGNSFGPARDMIRADEDLSDLLHVQEHTRTITHRISGATLKVVAADSEAVGGKKWTGTLVDELWLLGKRPGAEDMLREATGGMAARPEGFVIYLTTQSNEPPAGVFRQKLAYARKVRDGEVEDPRFLPVLYEYPRAMVEAKDYLDPATAYITNPNLGTSVSEAFLRRELAKAQEEGPESLAGFVAKHLNVEVGLALRSDRWAGADFWLQQGDTTLTLDEIVERSDVVVVGIDGGGLDDLLGMAVIGREAGTGAWLHWGRAWAHPIVLERRKSEAPRLRDFAKDGDLSLVEAIGDDVLEVVEVVVKIEASGKLGSIGVDPVGIGTIVHALEDAGIDRERIVGIPQGWKMAGAIKETERRLAGGTFVHCAQPLMAWCVSNCRQVPRGNAVAIDKAASGTAKIDPAIALFNAVALLNLNPEAAGAPAVIVL